MKVSIQEGSIPAITGFSTSALQTSGNSTLSLIKSSITACDTGAVVVSSSALPTGGATSALQTTGNASLSSIDGKVVLPSALSNGNLKVSIQEGSIPAITGFSTSALQTSGNSTLSLIKSSITACDTGAVVVSSSALPTGGATSALQTTGNASLSSIDGKVVLPSALSNGNLKVSIQEGSIPAITGFATSALQSTGNTSLATIATETTSIDGKITACNTAAVIVSSSALPTGSSTSAKQDDVITKLTTLSGQLPTSLESGRLKIDLLPNSGNGGDDIYTNATISSANTLGSTAISILQDKKLMIIGNTSTSTARIGLAFSDTGSGYHPGPQYADLYYDGSKYCFAMTVTNILTDNAKIYFQTPVSNLNMWYFTY